ncbi:hypothetical protein GGX14DRAFT_577794 [Mycena pura]|uniref:Uncharacterized protein n=1 Tax=Mycena pura TaxID=153505 RepID=A0AAD6XZY5_9AGAR|nr:hypothetical protein GGX14DRAFT_577794 [Mycena pura]
MSSSTSAGIGLRVILSTPDVVTVRARAVVPGTSSRAFDYAVHLPTFAALLCRLAQEAHVAPVDTSTSNRTPQTYNKPSCPFEKSASHAQRQSLPMRTTRRHLRRATY